MITIGEEEGLTPARLAQLIRGLRERHGWSQCALATAAGLSERTIQRVENAKGSNRYTRQALARGFGFEDHDIFEKPMQIPSAEQTPIPKRKTLFPEIGFRDFIQTTSRSESETFLAHMSAIIDDIMVKLEKNSEFIQITPIRDGRTLRTMLEQSLGHKPEEFGDHTPAAREAFAKLDNYLDSYYKIAIAKVTSIDAKLRSFRAALDLPPVEKLEAMPDVDERTRAKVADYLAKIDYYKNNLLNVFHEYSATERIRVDIDLDALLARISQQQCVIGAGLTGVETLLENFRIQTVHIVLAPEAAFPGKIRVPWTQEQLEKWLADRKSERE